MIPNTYSRKKRLKGILFSLICLLSQPGVANNPQPTESQSLNTSSENTNTASSLTKTTQPIDQPTDKDILWDRILTGKHRNEQSRDRDQYRHPRETLTFFEVEPMMQVAEIWPGGKGWYTEILAPYLKHKGKLYTVHFHPASSISFFRKSFQEFTQKIGSDSEVYKNITITTLQPPRHLHIAPKNSLDRVLTFRNVHNWIKAGHEQYVFSALFDALKPGGLLGVVEHRGQANMSRPDIFSSGYVPEKTVIKIAETAGFKYLAQSEINANPKDTKIHPRGVWTLLPSLRLKDENKDQYLAIGESDRMTLKFIKPMETH